MLKIAGTVTGDGPTPYTIYFNPDRLEKVIQKYFEKGAILKIGTAIPMEPAAAPTATVSFFKAEGRKHEKIGKAANSANERKDLRGGRHESKLKAVICVTTNRYFICLTDAALEYNLAPASVSSHINHPEKNKQVKGYKFRFATEADRQLSHRSNA